jgi:hypothetical protein
MGIGKTIVIAAATLLLGIFIGGIGPRAQLARTQTALEEAEARAKQAGASGASLPLALGLGSLAAARERANQDSARAPVPKFVKPDDDGEAEVQDKPDGGRRFRLGDPETFAAAKTAADLRAAQFRAAFVEEAKLAPAAVEHLDATVKGMNEEMGRAADELAKELAARHQGGANKLAPRELADVGARVLDIYRRADDKWKAGLDQGGRAAAADSDFDLLTQVDVGVFQRLSETLQTMDRPTLRPASP